MRSSLLPSVAAVALPLLVSTSLVAQQFTISQPNGNDNFGARSRGQSFTVSVGITPSPGSVATLPLTQITLYVGNLGGVSTSSTTYLNIYDGDPTAGGSFLGSSLNAIDTNPYAQSGSGVFRTPMVWDFPSLQLDLVTEYYAVMSSTNAAGGLDVELSLETELRNGPPGPNSYTGGTGLIANFAPHPNSVDTRFEIVFDTGGRFTVSGSGCPNSSGQATLNAPSVPQLGQGFVVNVSGIAQASVPFLILGFSDTQWASFPLPLALDQIFPQTNPACALQVAILQVLPMIVGSATATTTIPLPNNPTLLGQRFFVQGGEFEAAGLSVTGKGTCVIGS